MTVDNKMAGNGLYGSSDWATYAELVKNGYINGNGLVCSHKFNPQNDNFERVTFESDSHLLTVAPTRSGKGVSQIIPSLLEQKGGVLCIDPKGENAIITAEAREKYHGQKVAIFDPWNIATRVLSHESACFNPLDMLSPDSMDLADDALLIADALIVPERGGDSHWSNEARAMVMGFIIHLVTSPKEEGQRTIGRLREILSLSPAEFQALVMDMAENGHELAKSAGNRLMQKTERELSSVISTAQQNTHFLESRKVKDALSKSTFDFAELANDSAPLSAYIVLPADRLNTHGRLLRLMVSMAITAMVRAPKKPKKSALFLLDEFAALGKLAVVEQAYGLMAGFGMQIHAILQDLSQLQDLYDRRWQTFVANAGMIQVFGTRDLMTAEYISKLCGNGTWERVGQESSQMREGNFLRRGDPDFVGEDVSFYGRPLIMPEEITRMRGDKQILILPHCQPILGEKVPYFQNARYFDDNWEPVWRPHPNHPPKPQGGYRIKGWDEETRAIMARAQQRQQQAQEPQQRVKSTWFGYKVE